MQDSHAAAAAVQAASDVHQAASVGRHHGVDAGFLNVRGLVLDHRAADARVSVRKRRQRRSSASL